MKKKKRPPNSPASKTGLVRVGEIFPQLVARYGIQRRRNIERLAENWSQAVGEPFASVSRVVGLNRGTLEIAVPHNAFVQELSFRQGELLAKMQTANPEETIKKIKFVVG